MMTDSEGSPLAPPLVPTRRARAGHRVVAAALSTLASQAGRESRLADLARVVGDDERSDDEVARLHRLDLRTDFLDNADVLVTHQQVLGRLGSPVGPQIRPADASRREADDRVCRLDDLGVFALLDPDIAGGVHHNAFHVRAPLRSSFSCFPGLASVRQCASSIRATESLLRFLIAATLPSKRPMRAMPSKRPTSVV